MKPSITIGATGQHVARGVARIRKSRGLTQTQLSDALVEHGRALSRGTVAEIETCRRRVDVDDLAALSDVLGVGPEELLGTQLDLEQQIAEAAAQFPADDQEGDR